MNPPNLSRSTTMIYLSHCAITAQKWISAKIKDGMTTELYIEKWSNSADDYRYPWSVWQNGQQIHFSESLESQKEAEREGMHFCQHVLGVLPDRITRL